MVANIALHNVLEIINPEIVRGKNADEELYECNNLGIECF